MNQDDGQGWSIHFEDEPDVVHAISNMGCGLYMMCGVTWHENDVHLEDEPDDEGTCLPQVREGVQHKKTRMVSCPKCIEAIDHARKFRCRRVE